MPGLMGTGNSLIQGAIQGLDSAAGREAQRDEAAIGMESQRTKNVINTTGSAVGALAAGAVQLKKSGILNDIF